MSDLISRSELYMNDLIRRKDVLALFPTNDCSDKMVGLYERILDIPTAYSVEKVVAELEERRSEYEVYAENAPDEELRAYRKGVMRGCEYSQDIVRKGGVE